MSCLLCPTNFLCKLSNYLSYSCFNSLPSVAPAVCHSQLHPTLGAIDSHCGSSLLVSALNTGFSTSRLSFLLFTHLCGYRAHTRTRTDTHTQMSIPGLGSIHTWFDFYRLLCYFYCGEQGQASWNLTWTPASDIRSRLQPRHISWPLILPSHNTWGLMPYLWIPLSHTRPPWFHLQGPHPIVLLSTLWLQCPVPLRLTSHMLTDYSISISCYWTQIPCTATLACSISIICCRLYI